MQSGAYGRNYFNLFNRVAVSFSINWNNVPSFNNTSHLISAR